MIYFEVSQELWDFVFVIGILVVDIQVGKGVINWDYLCVVGGVGVIGFDLVNVLVVQVDFIIGIGMWYFDFIIGLQMVFKNLDVMFVNVNVGVFDVVKQGVQMLVVDVCEVFMVLLKEFDGYCVF